MAAVSAYGVTNVFIICLCACYLLGHKIDALISMNTTCSLMNEGYIADPSDCAGWGYCKGGVLAGRGKCSSGYLYDSLQGICNYANETNCVISKADICKGENAVLKPDPDDCNNYCYCNNGVTETGKCPSNQVYNPNTQTCVWADTYKNCISESPCRLVQNYIFTAPLNPTDCSQYLLCKQHIGYPGNCDRGYVFNPSNGKCDTFTTMNCPNKPAEPSAGEKTPNPDKICEDNYKSSVGGNQIFPDEVSCPGYIICTNSTNGVWQTCPWATHFDPDLKKCVTPYTVPCKENRCKNMNIQFMTAVGTGCKKYVTCTGQITSGTPQSCADPRYPYYAENVGGCVKDPPDQKICKTQA